MKKKLIALFMVLALLACILPAYALAAPSVSPTPPADLTVDEAEEAPAEEAVPSEDAAADEAADAAPDEAETEAQAVEGGEAVTSADTAPAPTEAQTNPSPEEIEAAAALAEMIKPDGDATDAPETDYVTAIADQVLYAYEGMIVYNNGGTVYGNLALVYNNGGTVYANGGTVYNNGGIVYANGGTVYNNAGTVYNNGAVIYGFDGDVQDSVIYGCYELKFAEYYEPYVFLDGTTIEPGSERLLVTEDGVCRITPNPGYRIAEAEATAGILTRDEEDGSVLLSEVDADLTLTLTIQADAPVFDCEGGTYTEEKEVSISALDGSSIYYTLDGSVPTEESALYEEPLVIGESCVLTAIAVSDGVLASEPADLTFSFLQFTAPEFDAVDAGYARQTARPVIVENTGDLSAEVISAELAGESPEAFTLSSTSGKTIPAGKINNSSWSIRPVTELAPGEYHASVIFTLDSGETVEIPVSFTVNEKGEA